MQELKEVIEKAYERRAEITPRNVEASLRDAVDAVIDQLDRGELRVAEKKSRDWVVNEWVKKAVLLAFRIQDNNFLKGGFTNYFDKFPSKYAAFNVRDFRDSGVRVVPPASARKGAYIAPGIVLMPSYVNLGAYVDSGTTIETWVTVGACAQIGKNVTLSPGVGIGGVLEPASARPTIVEDNCFIGSRSEVAEGVIVGEGSVLAMGVFLGQSTRIYHRETGEVTYGRVPPGSVVVPGSLPSADGRYSLYAAVIVKQVDEKTRARVGVHELLRTV
jgi:2,3,4,5-tetrahydropyridine-2-carboxylate N-succinyltransferase